MSQEVAGPGLAVAQQADPSFRWVAIIIGLYASAALAILPIAHLPGPEIPAITPLFAAGVLATELPTSFLLFLRFREARCLSILLLGCTCLFAGLMACVHLLTFPGAILPGRSLIGTLESTAWAFTIWVEGFATLALASILLELQASEHRIAAQEVGRAIAIGIGGALCAVAGATLAATVLVGQMPPLMQGTSFTLLNHLLNYLALAMMATGVGLILLRMQSGKELFLWLALAVTAMLVANLLSLAGGARYSIGWWVGRLSWFLAASILFLFFMAQFARQQGLLTQTREMLEQRVRERTADLTRTVRQRDLLLREVYHRVKNNLQVVDALLAMERRRISDPVAKEALAALRNRVLTLGLVHQQLMSSENLESFGITPFLQQLADNLSSSFSAAEHGIEIVVRAEPVSVTLDFAIPVGLLVTELLTNAVKHGGAGTVLVEFTRRPDGGAMLAVNDNGEDAGGGSSRLAAQAGVGSRIIAGLTEQLGGRMEVTNHYGTRVEIRLPLPGET